MLSIKFIKRGLPGILAITADFITGVWLLYNFASVLSILGLRSLLSVIPYISTEVSMALILVLLFWLLGSYKTDTSSIGRVSSKRPIAILFTLYIIAFTWLSLTETGILNFPQFLLKLLVITNIYAFIIAVNRLLIHLSFTIMLRLGWFNHKVLIVFHHLPEAPYLKEFLRYIDVNSLTLAGYCGNQKINQELFPNLPFLGAFSDTPEVIRDKSIDEVIILSHSKKTKNTERILTEINMDEVLVRLAPGTLESVSVQIGSQDLTEIPVISIRPKNITLWTRIVKRSFDICIALGGLTLTAVLYPFIARKIRQSSPGPVIFKQERMGKNRKPFMLYKFRTMYNDAEKDGPMLASKGYDERITSVGNFLRRNHFDELPQFWNILKGDMSVVGPRPERAHFVEQLEEETPYYRFITEVKPGLTSLGMVKYGYAHNLKEMSERLIYDIIYVNNQSFFIDIKIILSTFIYILKKMFFNEVTMKRNPPGTISIQMPENDNHTNET
jgi:exopolysaccharide biosynthesis polyprenyl glycosylphosphotransferase